MSSHRTHRMLLVLAAFALTLSTLAAVAACGEDDDKGAGTPTEQATATVEKPTATAAEAPRTPGTPGMPGTPGTPSPVSETGAAPIFWRTTDQFQSLRAREGYKVIFRVTNGYAEPTLVIIAEPAGGEALQIDAQQVQPGAGEAPGSYYAVNLELPQVGFWQLTVVAGEDQVTISVVARPSAAPID